VNPVPPMDRWEEEGALRELARLAADLPDVGADKAWERLDRLTETQAPPSRTCSGWLTRGGVSGVGDPRDVARAATVGT